jgi:hypothetical protein
VSFEPANAKAGAESQEAVETASIKTLATEIQDPLSELQARSEQSIGEGVEQVAEGVDSDAFVQKSLTGGFACSGRLGDPMGAQQGATAAVSIDQVRGVDAGAEAEQEAVVKVSTKKLLTLLRGAALELQASFEQSVGDGVEAVLASSGVDFDTFLRLSLRGGFACPGRFEFRNGEVWIYEFVNHPAHEAAAGVIVKKVTFALIGVDDLFTTGASPSVDNALAQFVYEPDGFIWPKGKVTVGVRELTPNVVIEVAFSETQPHVLAKAAAWIGHGFTVQQVIVIKIGANARVGGGRTMRAWSFVRGAVNPVQGPIDFDQVAGAGAAGMQLHVHHAQLLFGASAATVAAMIAVPNPIVVDLFHVQQQILKNL